MLIQHTPADHGVTFSRVRTPPCCLCAQHKLISSRFRKAGDGTRFWLCRHSCSGHAIPPRSASTVVHIRWHRTQVHDSAEIGGSSISSPIGILPTVVMKFACLFRFVWLMTSFEQA